MLDQEQQDCPAKVHMNSHSFAAAGAGVYEEGATAVHGRDGELAGTAACCSREM
jgi:hypothetical protein